MSNTDYSKWICVGIAVLSALLMHLMFFVKLLNDNRSEFTMIVLALVPIGVVAYAIASWYESYLQNRKY